MHHVLIRLNILYIKSKGEGCRYEQIVENEEKTIICIKCRDYSELKR